MEIPFVVKFTPEENTDYIHNLVCETEREKFIVPIRAIGARGLLDISDEIVFSQVPVKIESSKTVLVRNIGDAVAKFQIETDGRFSCTPKTASVQVGESIQVTIQFHPKVFYSNKNTGSFKSSMFINYHSGDKMVVDLIGTAENVNVRLEKSQIKFESSITLTTKKTFQIFNRSEHMVRPTY
jgi:hypothetical protein